MQVHFNVFACFGSWIHAFQIQIDCLIEMATKPGFTVYRIVDIKKVPEYWLSKC